MVSFSGVCQSDRYSTPAEYNPQNTYVSPDYDLMQDALIYKQIKYEKEVETCKNEVNSIYKSLKTYPEIIDGWHEAYALSFDNSLCGIRAVEVKDRKVVLYKKPDNSSIPVSQSIEINNAKTIIEIIVENEKHSLVLYFFK